MILSKDKKFTLLHLFILAFIVAIATYGLTAFLGANKINEPIADNSPVCKLDIKRLNGLKYIRPIMFADEECESDELSSLKQRISEIINRHKINQDAASASVFLKKFENGDWICLNDEEKYQPGSLFKVPVLITILKMNEETPGFLNKTVKFDKHFDIQKNVAYSAKSIQFGQSYTINELLKYMIRYSDNNATALLEYNMKTDVFQKIFEDMGLKVPNITDPKYFISVKEYSFFIRAIYNAAYLTINDSEYAAELLTECEFKNGMVKGLPAGTAIAHKFGESGEASEKQLHESGIVYLDGQTYLLTIMTRGKENVKLAKLIEEISQAVYLDFTSNPNSVM